MRGLMQQARAVGSIIWQGGNYQVCERPSFGMVIGFHNLAGLPPELLGKDAGKVLPKNAIKAFLLDEAVAGKLRNMLSSVGHDGFTPTRAAIETNIALIIDDNRRLLEQPPLRFDSTKYKAAMGRLPSKQESRRWDVWVQGFSLDGGAEGAMDIQVHAPWGELYSAVLEKAEQKKLLVSSIALTGWGPEMALQMDAEEPSMKP